MPGYFPYGPIVRRGWVDKSDILRWTPEGYYSSGYDLPGETVKTFTPYGVRGSRKYPMGKAFPELFELDGWDFINQKSMIIGIIVSLIILKFLFGAGFKH